MEAVRQVHLHSWSGRPAAVMVEASALQIRKDRAKEEETVQEEFHLNSLNFSSIPRLNHNWSPSIEFNKKRPLKNSKQTALLQ
jgi:oligoribonuclease (3'-5' exoribonuclease)